MDHVPVCAYNVRVLDYRLCRPMPVKKVCIYFGGPVPMTSSVTRTSFGDGHVELVGIDMPGLHRELISHMDAVRFFHLMKTIGCSRLHSFLGASDLKAVQSTCFLVANHL